MESQDSIAATSITSFDESEVRIDEGEDGIDGLPRYLTLLDHTGQGVIDSDVQEDYDEVGDGGDSDEECDDAAVHLEASEEVQLERLGGVVISENEASVVEDNDHTAILLTRETAEAGYRLPTTPADWKAPAPKVDKGEPATFEQVDNPGNWTDFTFRPVFASKGEYVHHALPTGATPVPEVNGKRTAGNWDFFYDGWSGVGGGNLHRSGATSQNLFPESRKGSLDGDVLKKLGLTSARLQNRDALFFYQLLLPICDPKRSGIDGDPREGFYSEAERFSNVYAATLGLGGSYGHNFRSIMLPELVRFDGVVVRDGVRGGSGGAIYRRWQPCADEDEFVKSSMTFRRWLQIKRVFKLCNNSDSPKRGEIGYDPAYKYDMLYRALFANVNALTKKAGLDLCGDESTWGHEGFGEAGSGLTGRIVGKPGVTKGGQIVMLSDVDRIRPRVYLHRHKLHPHPPGWMAMGPLEVRLLLEKITKMVNGAGAGVPEIFSEKPHCTFDNFFSGDVIFKWLGENGFGCTMTCRRDRLPADIPGHFLHKKKTDSGPRTKVARFHEPIVAVQRVEATDTTSAFERVHISFQSTSSCNISTVNALNTCKQYVRRRERGKGACKRVWGIEMNDARDVYLNTYSRIDSMDHLLKNARLFYRSWKYWHSPMLHGKALGIVIAYDMYLEVCEGKLTCNGNVMHEWHVDKPMDFWSFRERLSEQQCGYDPTRREYPGDGNMRVCTVQNAAQRRRSTGERTSMSGHFVTAEQYHDEKQRGIHSRLCGDLSLLKDHLNSVIKTERHGSNCVFCGDVCYTMCGKCGKALHTNVRAGPAAGKECFHDYHDDMCYGLARQDMRDLFGKRKQEWTPPSVRKRSQTKRHITSFSDS